MKGYELQSSIWLSPNELEVVYRLKSLFAGASAPVTEIMSRKDFIAKFGRQALPPRDPS